MGTSGWIASPRISVSGSIASGAAISGDIDLMGYRPAAIDFSSGWNASNMVSFKGSQDATNWFPLYDVNGAEPQIASGTLGSATGRSVLLGADISLGLAAHQFLRVQSGPSTAAVNQTTTISFTVRLVPM